MVINKEYFFYNLYNVFSNFVKICRLTKFHLNYSAAKVQIPIMCFKTNTNRADLPVKNLSDIKYSKQGSIIGETRSLLLQPPSPGYPNEKWRG